MVEAVREENPEIQRFETSVFDGSYITADIDQEYLERIDLARGDETATIWTTDFSYDYVKINAEYRT